MVKRSERVRVGVANCNKEGVVIWVMCDVVRGQKMIDFVVSRGANLSPTSHGLLGMRFSLSPLSLSLSLSLSLLIISDFSNSLSFSPGQFWNIPITVRQYQLQE